MTNLRRRSISSAASIIGAQVSQSHKENELSRSRVTMSSTTVQRLFVHLVKFGGVLCVMVFVQ